MSKNFHYMCEMIGMAPTTLATEEDGHVLSKNNILNFQRPETLTKTTEYSIAGMVKIYNQRMHTNISIEDFKNKDLSHDTDNESNSPDEMSVARYLLGDYIGLYLTPNGSGNVLGMYIRIAEDNNSNVVVHVIHKIQYLPILMHPEVDNLFEEDIEKNLCTFWNNYPHNTRGSKYFVGSVSALKKQASIEFMTPKGYSHCQILINLKGISSEGASPPVGGYWGGLGLAVARKPTDAYSMRFGLIRKEYVTKEFLKDEVLIKRYLSIGENSNGPLRITPEQDSQWYEQFLRYYRQQESQSHSDGK